jgi:transcriptional regulator with XRE-family HTH domain
MIIMATKAESPAPPNRIAALRQALGWSQDDLADKMRVSHETIRRYEKGDRDIDHATMIKLAAALGCQPFEIIADKEQIIAQEAAFLMKHRKCIDAYERLSEGGKQAVDHILYGSDPKPAKATPPEKKLAS